MVEPKFSFSDFRANLPLSLLHKAISETKGPFLWKYFDVMSFFFRFSRKFLFSQKFRRDSLKKYAVFA
jgi:hypothetical protein